MTGKAVNGRHVDSEHVPDISVVSTGDIEMDEAVTTMPRETVSENEVKGTAKK